MGNVLCDNLFMDEMTNLFVSSNVHFGWLYGSNSDLPSPFDIRKVEQNNLVNLFS